MRCRRPKFPVGATGRLLHRVAGAGHRFRSGRSVVRTGTGVASACETAWRAVSVLS